MHLNYLSIILIFLKGYKFSNFMASALVTPSLTIAKSFCPGHITGLFEPSKGNYGDQLVMGSRGAGFSIARGIETTVSLRESSSTHYTVSINGRVVDNAEVSRWVADRYLTMSERCYSIAVDHQVDIPIGYGLGSSGAAALSLSIALNNALDVGLSPIEVAQIAHIAEIQCKTGLGTVIAEFSGGFEIRTSPGAPGIGSVAKFLLDGYSAVILCISPISTKEFLTASLDSTDDEAGKMIDSLMPSHSHEEFLKMSFEFANHLGLAAGRCSGPLRTLSSMGYYASVALFGQTVFTLVPNREVPLVSDALRPFGGTLLTCDIDSHGARPL
jgi:pantoate kinase